MERDGGRRLLVWDAPGMDRCLADVIGQRTSAANRPHLTAVLEWVRTRADHAPPVEACVFCTVPAGLEATMAPWVAKVRQGGFAMFAKPTRGRNSVDADILRHIERRFAHGSLVELVAAIPDSSTAARRLRGWAQAGVAVAVLGYRERAPHTATCPELAFVDVEDIPGAFARPLPRTNLFDLPAGGRWFDPLPPDAAQPPETATRETVLALLESEVVGTVAAGAAGLTLRQVGDILRVRFARRPLGELGFGSVGELVDALVERGRLRLVRLDDGRHLLARRATVASAPGGPQGPVHPLDAADETQGPVHPLDAADEPRVPARPLDAADEPGPVRPLDGTGASPVDTVACPTVGDTVDHAGGDETDRSPAPPIEPAAAHPIYRAFGVRRLA